MILKIVSHSSLEEIEKESGFIRGMEISNFAK